MLYRTEFPQPQNGPRSVVTAICVLFVSALFATVVSAQTPTPTPITKPDPPTVQTPSTVGRITKWAGASKSGIGIIGDSIMTESGGNIGIDVTNPSAKLTVGGTITAAGTINTDAQYNIGGARIVGSNPTQQHLFLGVGAGQNNFGSPGIFANTFIGFNAGYNATGGWNTFVGANAGFNTATSQGADNSFFGVAAGYNNRTGIGNSFFGRNAGQGGSLSSGSYNAAFGYFTGLSNVASQNSFFGAQAGKNNSTGTNNLFLGYNAGFSNTTESNNTFVGANTNGAAGITNATALGANAVVMQSNSVVLGNNANVGIGTSAPQAKLHVVGNTAGLFDGNVTINGNISVSGTANLNANTADLAKSLASTASVNGNQVNGALANATIAGSAVTGSIAAGQVTGDLTNATISGYVSKSGDTMTGTLNLPTNGLKAGTNQLVLSGGNVGIGVTNPAFKLDVAGQVNATDVSASNVKLPNGTITGTSGSPLRIQGAMGNGGSTGGYLSLDPGGFYYPGGGVKLSAGATAPDYNSVPGAFITLDGNSYNTGGDIMIASGHAYGANTGGAITLNTNGAYAGNNPSPGYISLQIQGNESVRVASNGNVGIGTATPQAKLQVTNNDGTAGQFDGNVTVNGNLTVTGTTSLATNVNHDATLSGNGTAASPLSVVSAPNSVVTTGSYANPSWISSLDGSKITAGSVVKSVNGITDNLNFAAGNNVTITPSGNTLTISATGGPQLNPNQVALMRWYPANRSGITFTTGSGPSGIVFDGSSMWIANGSGDTVTRLRPGDGQVLDTFPTPANPGWMAFDGANIWIAHFATGTVSKMRASDGQVLATIPVGRGPVGIAFDGENVWVAAYQDWNVVKLRASDGAILGSVGVQDPYGLAFDGTNIWVSNNRGSGGVTKIAATGPVSVLGVCGTGQSFTANVAFDGSNIWTVNSGGNSVTKLRPSDCGNLGIYATGYDTVGIAFDGANIWVPSQDALYKLRASDGALLATVPMTANRGSAAFDGANIWVTHPFVNTVTKH
jgi:hypothetical protein